MDFLKQAWGLPVASLHIFLIVLLGWVVHSLARRLLKGIRVFMTRNADSADQAKRIDTLGRVAKHIVSLIVIVITGMLVLSVLGISIAPILGAAGVVGIAVGFAAQSLIKDYFNGFFLLLENQLRIGDQVDAGGKSGEVEEITLRFLRLRDADGTVHFVPNSLVTVLSNRSLDEGTFNLDVLIANKDEVASAEDALREVAAQAIELHELKALLIDGPNYIGVQSINDQGLVLRLSGRCLPNQQGVVKRMLLSLVLKSLTARGIAFTESRALATASKA